MSDNYTLDIIIILVLLFITAIICFYITCIKKPTQDNTEVLPVFNSADTIPVYTDDNFYIGYQNSGGPIIPPGPINSVHQIMLDSVTKPTLLNEDIDDTCLSYIEMITLNTPESNLLPLQMLDDKYTDITCGVCLEYLKIKNRPIIKFNCGEHYFHYSCYKCMAEEDNKEKRIKYLFGQIKSPSEMFIMECPYCRKNTSVEYIYIKYPETTQKTQNPI
jgi:hypothetical protein